MNTAVRDMRVAAAAMAELPVVMGLVYFRDDLGRMWVRPTTESARGAWAELSAAIDHILWDDVQEAP